MILVTGGAYQGKLDYAKLTYGVAEQEIFVCTDTEIDFSKRCICRIEEFVYCCVQNDMDAIDYFESHRQDWQNSILICQDITCGVVPMEARLRQWREMSGKLCQYLSREAEQVVRIFCGLEQRLK